MNLKSIYRRTLLWLINLLYYPNVLGYWSDNNTGGYCITNKECTRYRWIGYRNWKNWDSNPGFPRIYNERLEVISHKTTNLKTLWYLFQKDSKAQTRTYFAYNLLKLEAVSAIIWIATKLFPLPTVTFWELTVVSLIIVTTLSLINVAFNVIPNRKTKEQK